MVWKQNYMDGCQQNYLYMVCKQNHMDGYYFYDTDMRKQIQ